MRAESRTIFVTEGLDRHRERDDLSEEIVEANDGPAIRADLEILLEAHPVLRKSLLPFGIRYSPFSLAQATRRERLEHQAVRLAKPVRVALAAPAALETDLARQISLDQDVVRGAAGFELETNGPLDFDVRRFVRGLARSPPPRRDLEVEALFAAREPLDLDSEVGHGGESGDPA